MPKGMIEIRLEYVRNKIKELEKEYRVIECYKFDEKMGLMRAIDSWKVAEHELMLILEDPDIIDQFQTDGNNLFIKKISSGGLETDPKKIYQRYMHEFGMDNSWYAQHICSLMHIAYGSGIVLVKEEDEKTLYEAFDSLKRAVERVEKRSAGEFLCMGCREHKNKYKDGYIVNEGVEYCDECAKRYIQQITHYRDLDSTITLCGKKVFGNDENRKHDFTCLIPNVTCPECLEIMERRGITSKEQSTKVSQ